MSDNEVDFRLRADTDEAAKDIAKFGKESQKAVDGLKTGFKALATAAGAVAGAFAAKKVIDAASQQEQAVKSLNTALALTGEFTEENSQRFQDFASELQKNSTIGDEVSLSLVGLAKSMGATNEQTEQVIQAAADLSAVTGESLETSVRNITKTLGGLKGELGETQPELRNLTAEQLKAGAAIDILSKKYQGAAAALTETFAGAATQAQNSFGDLLEEIGFLITENPLVIKAINLASDAFSKLGEMVKENRESIIGFTVDAVAGVIRGFGFVIDVVGDVVAVFKNFDAIIDLTILSLADFGVAAIDAADATVKAFKEALNFGFKPLLRGAETLAAVLNKIGVVSDQQLTGFKEALEGLAFDSSTSGFEAIRKDAVAFQDAAREGFIESADALMETKDGFSQAATGVAVFADELSSLKDQTDTANESLKKLSETNRKIRMGTGVTPGTGALAPEIIAGQGPVIPDLFMGSARGGAGIGFTPEAIDQIIRPEAWESSLDEFFDDLKTGFKEFFADGTAIFRGIGAVAGGAEGARGLVSAGIGAGAEALLPGSGQAAQQLANLFMQGPEATRAQVEAFVDELPVIFDALAESAPVFVEALAENADKIIIAILNAMPKLLFAFQVEVPKAFIQGLSESLPSLFDQFREGFDFFLNSEFVTSIRQKLDEAGSAFVTGLTEGVESIVMPIGNAIGAVIDGLFQDFPQNVREGLMMAISDLSEAFRDLFDPFENAIAAFTGVFGDLAEAFNSLVGKIEGALNIDIGGGGGAVGGILERGRRALGFQDGGEVPSGFPNDTFPANLTSGENVIDRSTNRKLNDFLDSAGGSTTVILQVGEKQLAEVLLNINRQGFRTA